MKKIIKRIAVSLAALTLSAALSGCSLSALTAENVMKPPEAFGDGAELQAALEDSLGPQITLRYPRSGDHRSAVVRADVDNDGLEEAIVFYRPDTESTGARMVLMDLNVDGDWILTGEFADTAGDIDRVIFGDINGDGSLDIITGWSAYSDYGTLCIHSCSDGTLRRVSVFDSAAQAGAHALSSYTELAVGDFDGDGVDELLTVAMAGTDEAGEARLLKWQVGPNAASAVHTVSQLTLNPGASDYIASVAGRVAWNSYGIVIDSQRTGGGYASEMVLWDGDSRRLISPAGENGRNIFFRTVSLEASDVDGDSFIEIPEDSLLPGCSAPNTQRVYLTDWYSFNGRNYVRDFSAIMRPDSGYYFTVPDHWRGVVTAQPDAATRTLCFYRVRGGQFFSEELMRVRVFTLDEWDELNREKENSYAELRTTDYYVYAVQITAEDTELRLDYSAVLRYFTLIL